MISHIYIYIYQRPSLPYVNIDPQNAKSAGLSHGEVKESKIPWKLVQGNAFFFKTIVTKEIKKKAQNKSSSQPKEV